MLPPVFLFLALAITGASALIHLVIHPPEHRVLFYTNADFLHCAENPPSATKMSNEVNLEDVRAKVHDLIVQADKEGTLEYVFIFRSHTELTWTRQGREYTPRIVRQKIEEELSLESGILDAKEYKTAVKDALTGALVRTVSDTS